MSSKDSSGISKTSSFFVGCVIEQILVGLIAVGFGIFFFHQISISRKLAQDSSYKYHVFGIVCALLLVAHSIDPFGLHGFYHPEITAWFLVNVAILLATAASLWVSGILESVFSLPNIPSSSSSSSSSSPTATPSKWVTWLPWVVLGVSLVAWNVLFLIAHYTPLWLLVAVFFAWLAAVFASLLLLYLWGEHKLYAHSRQIGGDGSADDDPAAKKDRKLTPPWRRGSMIALFIFWLWCIILLIVLTLRSLIDGINGFQSNSKQYIPVYHLFLFTELVALAILAWDSRVVSPSSKRTDESALSSSETAPLVPERA